VQRREQWSDRKKWIMGIVSALVIAALVPLGAFLFQRSRPQSLDVRYKYFYTHGSEKGCAAVYQQRSDGTWTEKTLKLSGCQNSQWYFKEIRRYEGWILLYDASGRDYYIRLPAEGGWVQVGRSPDGPWSDLHEVVREAV
jgi:hypothetical protein